MRKLLVGVGTALLLIGAGCAKPETTPAPETPAAPQANVNANANVNVNGSTGTQGTRPAPSTERKTWVTSNGMILLSVSKSYAVTQADSGGQSAIFVKDGSALLVEVFMERPTREDLTTRIPFSEWIPDTTIMETPSRIGGIDMYVDPATGDTYGVIDAKSGTYVRVHRVTSNRTVGDAIVSYMVFNPSATQRASATVIP